jgi:hypothetical protein
MTKVNFLRNSRLNRQQNHKQAEQKNLHVLNLIFYKLNFNFYGIIKTDVLLVIMVMSPQNE